MHSGINKTTAAIAYTPPGLPFDIVADAGAGGRICEECPQLKQLPDRRPDLMAWVGIGEQQDWY